MGSEMDGMGGDLTQSRRVSREEGPQRLRVFDWTSGTRPESNPRNVGPEEVGRGGSVGTLLRQGYAGQAPRPTRLRADASAWHASASHVQRSTFHVSQSPPPC